MDLTAILQAPPETLVPVGWVRDHLLPQPDPELVRFLLAIEVAAAFWAGVVRGEIPAPLAQAGRLAHGNPNDDHESSDHMQTGWREKYGVKGQSRVTLFNRPGESPFIYIEWWQGQKRKVRRLEIQGVPVQDKLVAQLVALVTVNRLEEAYREEFWGAVPSLREISSEVRRLLNIPEALDAREAPANPRPGTAAAASAMASGTVGQLFERWLSVQKANLRKKQIARRHWEEALGADTVVATLTPADVNEVIGRVAAKKGWSVKTTENYGSLLRMAFTFASEQLEWAGPRPERIEVPKAEIPDTQELTYEESEYHALLSVVVRAIAQGDTGQVARSERRKLDTGLLVGGALSICGTLGRRIEQVTVTRAEHVTRKELAVGEKTVGVIEIQFPRVAEKARRFKDADHTVGWITDLEHPQEYKILMTLLHTRAVQESGFLFPSLPNGRNLDDALRPVSITQDTIRTYLRKIEADAGVESVEDRAFHGLKRLAATRCRTMEELELVSLLSNTSLKTLMRYHKRLGTFENDRTRQAMRRSLQRGLAQRAAKSTGADD